MVLRTEGILGNVGTVGRVWAERQAERKSRGYFFCFVLPSSSLWASRCRHSFTGTLCPWARHSSSRYMTHYPHTSSESIFMQCIKGMFVPSPEALWGCFPPPDDSWGGNKRVYCLAQGLFSRIRGPCEALPSPECWQQRFLPPLPRGERLQSMEEGWCVEIEKLGQSLQDAGKLCIRRHRRLSRHQQSM